MTKQEILDSMREKIEQRTKGNAGVMPAFFN
jgi:hypothetical protein